jgi:hypothetical protein
MSTIRRCLSAGLLCLGVALLAAAPASAQTYTGVTPPALGAVLSSSGGTTAGQVGQVLSSQGQVLSSQVSQAPLAVGATQARSSGLAFTGADIATLVVMAGSLILGGAVLTRRARPRTAGQG